MKYASVVKLISSTVITALVCTVQAQNNEEVVARQLLQNEQALNQAFLHADVATAGRLLSNDWLLITSTGHIQNRAQALDSVNDPQLVFERNDAEDVQVRIWADTAVLTGVLHQVYSLKGEHKDYRVRYTDTWVRRNNGWQQVSGHASVYAP